MLTSLYVGGVDNAEKQFNKVNTCSQKILKTARPFVTINTFQPGPIFESKTNALAYCRRRKKFNTVKICNKNV